MNNARGWAWATLALGAATLGLFIVFAMLPEARAAAACLPAGAVVQFELARNAADLAAIFGPADSACRPLAAAAMDAVNRLDMAAFIPVYTAFCACAALLLAGGALRPLAIAGVFAALGAAAGDYVETNALLAITSSLDDPLALAKPMQLLPFGAWSKFALLAAHALCCAGLCFLAAKRRLILGALLLLPAPGVAIAAFDHLRFANVMNVAFAIAWLALLAVATRDALRKRAG